MCLEKGSHLEALLNDTRSMHITHRHTSERYEDQSKWYGRLTILSGLGAVAAPVLNMLCSSTSPEYKIGISALMGISTVGTWIANQWEEQAKAESARYNRATVPWMDLESRIQAVQRELRTEYRYSGPPRLSTKAVQRHINWLYARRSELLTDPEVPKTHHVDWEATKAIRTILIEQQDELQTKWETDNPIRE